MHLGYVKVRDMLVQFRVRCVVCFVAWLFVVVLQTPNMSLLFMDVLLVVNSELVTPIEKPSIILVSITSKSLARAVTLKNKIAGHAIQKRKTFCLVK